MKHRFARLTAATVMAATCLLGAGQIGHAAPNGGGPPPTDMDNLKAQGYTCGRMGVGGHLCMKKGKPDQICDNAGTCSAVKVIVRPGSPIPRPTAATATRIPVSP